MSKFSKEISQIIEILKPYDQTKKTDVPKKTHVCLYLHGKIYKRSYVICDKQDEENLYQLLNNVYMVSYMNSRQILNPNTQCEVFRYGICEIPGEYTPFYFDIDISSKDVNQSHKYDRLYNDTLIKHIIEIFNHAINTVYTIKKNDTYNVYIFTKEHPDICSSKNGTLVKKDGIHGMYKGLVVNKLGKTKLFEAAIKYAKTTNYFDEYGGTEILDHMFDKGASIYNAWNIYGSSKSFESSPYVYFTLYDKNYSILETDSKYQNINKIIFFSITNTDYCQENKTPYSDEYKDLDNLSTPLINIDSDVNQTSNITIKIARDLVDILDEKRCTEHNSRIAVGWVLKYLIITCNFSAEDEKELKMIWLLFCQKNPNYKNDEYYINQLDTLSARSTNQYTLNSLDKWAREDNPDKYADIINRYKCAIVENMITNLSFSDVEVACYFYIMRFLRYKYTKEIATTTGVWYKYIDHCNYWKRINDADIILDLSQNIRKNIVNSYNFLLNTKSSAICQTTSKFMENNLSLLAKQVFISKLSYFYEKFFYDSKFTEILDTNDYLIAFTNGVYDLQHNEYRIGDPSDNISISTHIRYIPYNKSDPVFKCKLIEVKQILKDILPDKEIRKYFMLVLSLSLCGINKEQKFYIENGMGSNGKSLIFELAKKAFGDYYMPGNITLLTKSPNSSNSASPDLYSLKGKRLVVFTEVDADATLQLGIIKSLTGCDEINSRPLYKDPVTFKFQGKIHLCCNNIPKIITSNSDFGTYRRVNIINFGVKFCESPKNENERKIDPSLYQLVKEDSSYAECFMSLLIHIFTTKYNINKPILLKIPEKILQINRDFERTNNLPCAFFDEHYTITGNSTDIVEVSKFVANYKTHLSDIFGNKMPRTYITQKSIKEVIIQYYNIPVSEEIINDRKIYSFIGVKPV